jgi:hypothetical protein
MPARDRVLTAWFAGSQGGDVRAMTTLLAGSGPHLVEPERPSGTNGSGRWR